MNENKGYKHLEHRSGSKLKQPFVKGRKLSVDWLYHQTIGEDARTPEEVAHDYHLPLEVVQEAIDYCVNHPDILQEDLERELARYKEFDAKYPPILPPEHVAES
jgi:uncharacterized protein (DUF433 family)